MKQPSVPDLLPQGYVDAHHHVWAPDTRGDKIGYGWLRDIGAPKPFGDPTPIQRDYLWPEFLSEMPVPPRASVHVQTDGALPDPVAETQFVHETAAHAGHPVAIVGLADLGADDLADTLRRHAAYDSFRGVRQIVARLDHRPDLSFAARDFLSEPAWCNGLKILEDQGLTFDLQLYPEQAEKALEALSATPALTVIIDHALSPHDQTPDGLGRWSRAIRLMAERPQTLIKLSGWGMYDAGWATSTASDLSTLLSTILTAFGPRRVMWGSNYPVEKLATPYADMLLSVASGLRISDEDLSPDDMTSIFLQTAAMAYGLELT